MATVEEYVTMAEEAGKDGAHVAVSMCYRGAIEVTGYTPNAAPILLAFMQYGQRFKKDRDRERVAEWGTEVLGRIGTTSLNEIIVKEIAKLEARGENATT